MTREELEQVFEEDTSDWSLRRDKAKAYIQEHMLSSVKRDDLLVFMFLDMLAPNSKSNGTSDIVCAAEHDQIFIGVDPDDLCNRPDVVEEDLVALRDLGLLYDSSNDSFYMFA